MSKKAKTNFIELCCQGEVLTEEIDNWVDDWHESKQERELHDFLGMSWEEYSAWVSLPEILPIIVTAHKENKNFSKLLYEFQSLPIAARADAKLKVQKLVGWLKSQGKM